MVLLARKIAWRPTISLRREKCLAFHHLTFGGGIAWRPTISLLAREKCLASHHFTFGGKKCLASHHFVMVGRQAVGVPPITEKNFEAKTGKFTF